jgi:hypothetical protein
MLSRMSASSALQGVSMTGSAFVSASPRTAASERQPRKRAATELRKPSGMKRMFEEIARQTPQEIGTAEPLDTYLQ